MTQHLVSDSVLVSTRRIQLHLAAVHVFALNDPEPPVRLSDVRWLLNLLDLNQLLKVQLAVGGCDCRPL